MIKRIIQRNRLKKLAAAGLMGLSLATTPIHLKAKPKQPQRIEQVMRLRTTEERNKGLERLKITEDKGKDLQHLKIIEGKPRSYNLKWMLDLEKQIEKEADVRKTSEKIENIITEIYKKLDPNKKVSSMQELTSILNTIYTSLEAVLPRAERGIGTRTFTGALRLGQRDCDIGTYIFLEVLSKLKAPDFKFYLVRRTTHIFLGISHRGKIYGYETLSNRYRPILKEDVILSGEGIYDQYRMTLIPKYSMYLYRRSNEVRPILEDIIKRHPSWWEPYYFLAETYKYDKEEHALYYKYCKKAVELSGNMPATSLSLAATAFKDKHFDICLDALSKINFPEEISPEQLTEITHILDDIQQTGYSYVHDIKSKKIKKEEAMQIASIVKAISTINERLNEIKVSE